MKIPAKNFMIDMDGVLIKGKEVIPGAGDFIKRLKQSKKEYLVLTNIPLSTPRDLTHSLGAIDLDIPPKRIFTSALATA